MNCVDMRYQAVIILSKLLRKLEHNTSFPIKNVNRKVKVKNKTTNGTFENSENRYLHLVPPSPEAADQIRKQMEKLRGSTDLSFASLVTIREKSYPGMNDGLIYPGNLFPLGTTASIARNAAAQLAPPRGTIRVIVVLAQFSDKAMSQTKKHFEDLLFSTGVISSGSMREYWREVTNVS